jgi:RNA recognition motif-containing protein
MTKNLFVAGLSYDTKNESLHKHFSEIGTVVSAQVIMDKYTNQSKGFGFVEMTTEEDARLAMDKLNNSSLDGRNIVVKEAKPREEYNNSRSGGYNNRGTSSYNRDTRGSGYKDNYRKKDNKNRY